MTGSVRDIAARRSRHRFEQSVALGLGVGLHRRREPGDAGREVGEDTRQLAAEGSELGLDPIGGHARDVVPQRFGERLERHAELFVAAAPQHGRSVSMRVPHELAHQPRLADARLARHEHRAACALDGLLPRREHRVVHLVAARERERRATCRRTREAVPRSSRSARRHSTSHTRSARGQALQLTTAQGKDVELGARPGEHADEIADEDLPAVGRRAEPRRPRRRAYRTSRRLRSVASPALIPDAHREPAFAELVVVAVDRALHRDPPASASAGARVRHHHRVADRLHLGAARRGDRLAEDGKVLRVAGRRPRHHRGRTPAPSNRRDP